VKTAVFCVVEAAGTFETSANFTGVHGTKTQKTAIFMLATVRTSDVERITGIIKSRKYLDRINVK
jgi:hypothetical protein